MKQGRRIRELINRLARLDTTQAWQGDLNPTQYAVLDYLSRANRFSRSPSNVADYLGTTRGTISQSLKSLGEKGYVVETRSQTDRRTIRFDLTETGRAATRAPNMIADAVAKLDQQVGDALTASLDSLLTLLLRENGGRPFGICKDCMHFDRRTGGGFCMLLSEELSDTDATQICFEQATA